MRPILLLLIAGSLSQLGAFAPSIDRGGHLEECMEMAERGIIGARFQIRCAWHLRRAIDEKVRLQ